MTSIICATNVATAIVLLYVCALSSGLSAHYPIGKSGSTKGQEEIGPIDNYTCTANGAFPHEECDLFITCWNGSALLHRCTEVMLFDLRYNGCDWAENVDCGERHRPPTYPGTETPPARTTTVDPTAPTTPTTPTTPPPNGTFVCPANGVFPHAEKCEYYWNCYDDVALLIHCEFDYLFDLTYNGCNFPDLTDCGDRERPPTPSTTARPTTVRPSTTESSGGTTQPGDNSTSTAKPSTTEGPGEDFECPSPSGVFPDPESCTSYYSCLANIPTKVHCPDGLHFNPELELCDWPEAAGCELKKGVV